MLPVKSVVNIRDLGGYQSADGRFVKWRKLIRSGELSGLTESDQQELLNYGVSCIVDLRSNAEIDSNPDVVPKGIDYVRLPVFDNDETESKTTVDNLNQMYSDDPNGGHLRMMYVYRRLVLNSQPRKAYREFLQSLLVSGEDKNILYHCASGKDRTGMCSILLLGALGVDWWQIKQDYLLTNQLITPKLERRITEAKKAHMGRNFLQSLQSLTSVSDDYFDQAMTLIQLEFGGIIPYLTDYVGFSNSEIADLKRLYLVGQK
ncbi:tyrosine-protein phosphatase [Lentilactobacillus sp. Marseille-Q4993]|uniref:tyrosine-protein phosphatase n=1 Tax=Lentilactobacillus sp. Marseille-Q4993 TaxID=3039492 RepID=UPI0024BCBE89|nr:tyrosine-protein phosphatase [Lentilactobacillus sp. Marseille-Q4993]